MPVPSAQIRDIEMTSRIIEKKPGPEAGCIASVCGHGATPTGLDQPEQVRGASPPRGEVGLIALRHKQERPALEAMNSHSSSI